MALAMKIQYSILNLTQTNSILLILFWTKLILGWLRGWWGDPSNPTTRVAFHLSTDAPPPNTIKLIGPVLHSALCLESVLVQSITQCAWGLRTHLGDHDSVLYFTALQIQPSSLFYIILTHKHLVDFSCVACPSGLMVSCFDISIFLLISITPLSAFFTIRQPSFVAESHENFGAKSFSLFLSTLISQSPQE